MSENVNHPSHYQMGGVEVIDAIEAWGFGEGFNRGDAIKYIARAGRKNPETEIEDLEKALWYISREIQRLKKRRMSMSIRKGSKGDDVKAVQRRLKELGFLSGSVDGDFGPVTEKAVKAFQKANGLTADGIVGSKTLAALGVDLAKTQSTDDGGVHGTARTMDWWTSDIQKIFAVGVVATITDVDTGISWKEKRFAGKNHADIQPLTKADTAKLKKVYGHWSWKRRAVFVTINGENYAASIHGMPHGGSNLNNNFPGHHCCHFLNSRTHGSNKVDANHQKMVAKAAKAKL